MSKISVIIPYFNNQHTILRALKSVKAQTYKDFELILVDDGSTDNSCKIVENFVNSNKDLNIRSIHQNNAGPSVARNNGIKLAEGEYIAFLDSDDEWLPQKLAVQLKLLERYEMDLLGCNYYIIKNNTRSKFSFIKEGVIQISFKKLLFKHYYATPCVIMKKKIFEELGLFPEEQKYMEDAYVFTKAARSYKAYMTSDFLVNIYKAPYGEKGLSAELDQMEKYELYNFKKFKQENKQFEDKLGFGLFVVVNVFSILKYLKRKVKL